MAEESETATGTSNWAAMYFFISIIPVIAIMVMVYSNWADRTKQAAADVEIAAHAATYQRYWSPWREATGPSERSRGAQAGPSSIMNRQAPVTQVSEPARETLQVAPQMGPSLTINVTAPTPSPPPPPPPPKMPAPIAHPSRLEQGRELHPPFDNSANERWGEGPHGYGARRASATEETEFQDVSF